MTGGRAEDTAGEPGSFEAYFLGSGVPSGAASVVVNRTSNTTTMWAVGILISAATDTEVYLPGIVLTQNNAAPAEQSVDDGSPGTSSMRFAGVYYGGATPAPAGTSSTQLVSGGVSSGPGDATAYGWNVVRETTAGQGARNVGCVNATSDDHAGVHLAVREQVTPAPRPPWPSPPPSPPPRSPSTRPPWNCPGSPSPAPARPTRSSGSRSRSPSSSHPR